MLIVVGRDGRSGARAEAIAPTLQAALDDWDRAAPALRRWRRGSTPATRRRRSRSIPRRLGPPLPRAYEWVDGSAFLNHVLLVRKARGRGAAGDARDRSARLPGRLGRAARADRRHRARRSRHWGSTSSPRSRRSSATRRAAPPRPRRDRYVRLLMLANDVTLRNLVPAELAKGFGFFQSKPATAFSPFAVTPDELGDAWRDGRVHLRAPLDLQRRARRRPRRRRDALLVLRSHRAHRQDAARSPPARSSAAAPSRTRTARAASRASPSGA